jgi:hypothetical protein
MPAIGVGCRAGLAGSLKCENLPAYRLRKIDEGKLSLVEEIILPALVDNPYQVVFGRSDIG